MTNGLREAGILRNFRSPVFFGFYLTQADIRHSSVSLLINMGFTAVAIGNRVGHESADITYRYAHMFPSEQKEMATMLNEAFVMEQPEKTGNKKEED